MLENTKIDVKLKLSALWGSLIALYIYGDYFELYVPNKVNTLIEGTSLLDSPNLLLTAAIVLTIPGLMIALSLMLKPQLNRILNILFGIVFTLIVIIVGSTAFYEWYSFYVLYAGIEAIITALIVYHAWKWPRIETQK